MIAAALQVLIETHASTMRRDNALLRRAAAGTLGPDHVARYLAGIHQLILQTPLHLQRARRRAAELGDTALARHFAHKLSEEVGHDAWAESDLAQVAPMRRVPAPAATSPAMAELIGYVGSLVDERPSLYLAYILVAEYMTVLLGPEWIALLETRCAIPASAMTVIGNHAELDKAHTQEAFDHVDALVGDPSALPLLRDVVRTSLAMFERFCREVVDLTDRELAAVAHAPAA